MKKIYLILSILVLTFSCADVERPNLGLDTQWLQFENASDQVAENSPEPLLIPVLYSAPSNDTDIDVSFTYTASSTEGYTLSPANGVVTIPAGEFVAYITLTPINDNTSNEDIVFNFSIEGNSGYPLGIAGEGVYNVTSEVTILEDDCPIAINDWAGTYTVNEQFTSGVNAPNGLSDFFGESYQIELSVDASDPSGTQVIVNNTPGFNTYINNGTVMSFLTCNEEIEFDAGFPLVAEFAVYEFTSSSFNTETYTIICSGPLATYGPYEFSFTKQ